MQVNPSMVKTNHCTLLNSNVKYSIAVRALTRKVIIEWLRTHCNIVNTGGTVAF